MIRDTDSTLPSPACIGPYRIEGLLGDGGMGYVLRASHVRTNEPVALKVLRPERIHSLAESERFLREARVMSRIRSEHVVRVIDGGRLATTAPFFVMERLEGEDCAAYLRRSGPLSVEEAVDFVVQACAGIAAAHAVGVIHRDLKPSNLFLTRRADGSPLVKVLDFGISKLRDHSESPLTTQDEAFGTPSYMPPEQLHSMRDVDERADVWSLGVTLFELLTRQMPFGGRGAPAILYAIATARPRTLRSVRPELPEALCDVIAACLVKNPSERIQSVTDLARRLAPWAPVRKAVSVPRRSETVLLVAAAVIALAACLVTVRVALRTVGAFDVRMGAWGSVASSSHAASRSPHARAAVKARTTASPVTARSPAPHTASSRSAGTPRLGISSRKPDTSASRS